MSDIFNKTISSRILPLSGFDNNSDLNVFIKREDEIHQELSGNKWRKLKYNFQKAVSQNYSSVLTFGGAFSNHIAATAAAGKYYNIKTIGLIRGEEHLPLNPTLKKAKADGMSIHYLSREEYQLKDDYDFLDELRSIYGRFVHVPEGGSNYLGINGCMEILDGETDKFDLIALPVGTAGTISGMAMSLKESQKLMGFSALKGVDHLSVIKQNLNHFLPEEESINQLLSRITIVGDDYFGGYAKINKELIDFIREFYETHKILLDPVYTGKMMYSLSKMIKEGQLDNYRNLLVIHTGGLQGIRGFEHRGLIKDLHYMK